jgi:hypothetical protein
MCFAKGTAAISQADFARLMHHFEIDIEEHSCVETVDARVRVTPSRQLAQSSPKATKRWMSVLLGMGTKRISRAAPYAQNARQLSARA